MNALSAQFKNKKLICFDLDGTLIDSVGIWNQIDAELIAQLSGQHIDLALLQYDRDQQLQQFRQQPDPYLQYCEFLIQKYQLQATTAAEVKTRRYQIAQYFLDHVICLKPHAVQCLHRLIQNGFLLALTTTTSRDNLQRYQNNNPNIYHQLNFTALFSLILTREDVQQIKPDPEVYLAALQHFQLSADQCLIIEDSLVGVAAAKHAGVDVVAIYDVHSQAQCAEIKAQADAYVQDYTEILTALNHI